VEEKFRLFDLLAELSPLILQQKTEANGRAAMNDQQSSSFLVE
jgi:hypothetical protein